MPDRCLCVRLLTTALLICTFMFGYGVAAGPLQAETIAEINQQLVQTPHDTSLLAAKGAMQRQARDYADAIDTYEKLRALTPDDARARNLLVMVLHKAAQEHRGDRALELLQRAVALAPEANFIKPAYLEAAYEYGTASELIDAYESLPPGHELDAPVLVAVADACREAEKRDKAAALYRSVLNVAPADADAGLGLALVLLDAEHYADARDTIQTTIHLNPKRTTLRLALAAIHWQSGDRVRALDTFDHILEIDPANADAVNLKAQLLCEMGSVSLAREVVAAHPARVWDHVRCHIQDRLAESHAAWAETTAGATMRAERRPDHLLALCYYDVSEGERSGPTSITPLRFMQHIEYLRTHGYHFVSAGDVVAARRGEHPLPDHAVLLSFDHGYAGFIKHVVPVLELYNIPAIVSVCPAWLESGPPVTLSGPLMSWTDIARLAGHRLVTLGVEAEGLFELVNSNPQGDVGFAALTRIYDRGTQRYETEAEQRERIQTTLSHAMRLMQERVGARPRVLVWSHGARNAPAMAEAERLGFVLQLSLHGQPHLTDTDKLERTPVLYSPAISGFISLVKPPPRKSEPIRAVSVSPDAIDSSSPQELDSHLVRLILRLKDLGANTVILDACSDRNGDDLAEAAYFPTTQFPVRNDILDHIAALLQGARFRVLVRMPVLMFQRPATPRYDRMRVMEAHGTADDPSFTMQKRLSPFHPDVIAWTAVLYRDLAAHVRCNGIVCGEDAYLTDSEDYNATARKVYIARLGTAIPGKVGLAPEQGEEWVRIKTATLTRLTERLIDRVQQLRPRCASVRTLYAPVLHYPASRRWFAQDYNDALQHYDRVLLLAYAEMEDIRRPEAWLSKLVKQAEAKDGGLEKTIFKLQAMNWRENRPIKARVLRKRLAHLAQRGALHFAYGPDNPLANRPRVNRMDQALQGV